MCGMTADENANMTALRLIWFSTVASLLGVEPENGPQFSHETMLTGR